MDADTTYVTVDREGTVCEHTHLSVSEAVKCARQRPRVDVDILALEHGGTRLLEMPEYDALLKAIYE